jgi:hypothetical protein
MPTQRPNGWKRESRRHRNAYYKGRINHFKNAPTPTGYTPEFCLVNGELIQRDTLTSTPTTPTRPLPPIKLYRIGQLSTAGDDLTKKAEDAKKVYDFYKKHGKSEEIDVPESPEAIISSKDRFYFGLNGQGEIVGAVAINRADSEIKRLLITPKKTGYAQAMLKKIEDDVIPLGRGSNTPFTYLFGSVKDDNTTAKKFWKASGFREIGQGNGTIRFEKTYAQPTAPTSLTRITRTDVVL